MKQEIFIDGRPIGPAHPPYVIAELSANHNGSLEKAKQIVTEAYNAGADAVKLQTYRPDTITLEADSDDFRITGGLWDGRSLFELYQEAHTPWEWHPPLFDHARSLGITIFSSPFDTTAIDMLEELNAPAYKIASFEAADPHLIAKAASTGKPVIISTGLLDHNEIAESIGYARDNGNGELAILHCVSGYPAPATDCNLKTIPNMIESFNAITGLSDHTQGNATAIASIALGASIIEKHFTIDRNDGGPDSVFSLEPHELKQLCTDAKTAFTALGKVNYGLKTSEQDNARFRRSLYFVNDLVANSVICADDIRSIRPGFGLAPKHLDELIGRKVTKDVKAGTATSWQLVR